jgi:hypothetical protein
LGSSAGRQDPSFILSNSPVRDSLKNIVYAFPLSYNVTNNIIYGLLDDEIAFNEDPEGKKVTNKTVKNNLIKTQLEGLDVSGNLINADPLFVDVFNNNYEITGPSPCNQAGASIVNFKFFQDLKGLSRNIVKPSIGAYEAPK